MARKANNVVPVQQVESLIYLLRGQKAMLDSDLAALYGVPTKVLNQAVRRNLDRFPEDFMFQLSVEELQQMMRSQIVTSSDKKLKNRPKSSVIQPGMWSQIVTTSSKRRHTHSPYVFTEQGIAMLSSVLRSSRAVQVNIEIMRAFVKIRQWLASNADLSRRLDQMEKKFDYRFKIVFDAIREMTKPDIAPRREIGFHVPAILKTRKNPAKRK
jgi:hypothetical protein